jgi:hypothetical protein
MEKPGNQNEQIINSEQDISSSEDVSYYVTIAGNNGNIQSVTPVASKEDLATVERTLKSIQAIPVTPPKTRAPKTTPFPAITSNHATPLPGTESFLVITGSFGPNVIKQDSLWPEEKGFTLTTPTGELHIEGISNRENSSLQQYVASELGPEGLKELAGLIDIYIALTQGVDQEKNIEVTAKQVLQRMGKGKHADDNNEQNHLLNTTLYLSRTYVITRKARKTRFTPLLLLESITTDEYDTIWIKYHLGEEFFDAIFKLTSERKPFPLPTPRIIGYHSSKSQYELMLTFFLGNLLAQGEGKCSLYFVTLCIQSGLIPQEKLLPNYKNRMRDAQKLIAAIMQLEQDGFIQCMSHPDLDIVVAVNILLDSQDKDKKTLGRTERRLQTVIKTLKSFKPPELKAKRRSALQRLLNIETAREDFPQDNPELGQRLTFLAGEQFLSKQQEFLDTRK